MKLFSIFPHTAYLNTEIHIVSESTEDIVITNTTTDERFTLTKEEHRVLKLPAGRHLFKCKNKNEIQIEEINVENGIKLGGSKLKKTYLFEESPWVVVVMKDRTYFYNRETEREFVELNFSPEDGSYISDDYIMFSSKDEYTIFSLCLMLPIISFKSSLYLDDKYVVINETEEEHSTKKLAIYSYNDNKKEELLCEEFTIDKENKTIYTLENGIICSYTIDNYTKKEILNVGNNFRCFIQEQYVISEHTKYNKKELKVYDLHKGIATTLLKDYRPPIISINNNEIKDANDIKNSLNKLVDLHKDDCDAIKIDMTLLYIEVFITKKSIYCVTKSETTNVNINGRYKTDKKSQIIFIGADYKKEIDYYSTFEIFHNKLIINSGKELIVFKGDKELSTFKDGYLIKTPTQYVYHISHNNIDYIYNLSNNLIHKGTFETRYLTKYGVIISKDKENVSHFFYIGNKYPYFTCTISHISETDNNLLVFSRNNPHPSIHTNGVALPFLYKTIDNISENGLLCFNIDGNKLILSSWDSNIKGYKSEEILSSLYDSNSFSDAYFANGGSSLIYKKENESNHLFFDIFKQEEIEFENVTFIQSSNGYRPLVDFDSYRKPIIKDPVTMQTVPSEYLSQYDFVSPDGKYYVKTNKDIEYYHKFLNKNISEQEYINLQKLYNYNRANKISDELKKRRIEFIKKYNITNIGEWKINYTPDFVETVIVELIEFINIIETQTNNTIRIKLGTPPLWFLNYVSFSYDNKYIAIAGRYPNNSDKSGLFLLYDIVDGSVVYESTQSNAVWVTAFNKKGEVCYYTSDPVTYRIDANKTNKVISKNNRNFLCFSPSGKYIAMSNQGYVAINSDNSKSWGHQLSSEIFIYLNSDSLEQKYYFNDHGDSIKGVSYEKNNVAYAAISNDDKKLLSISNDGVIIVRNLE